jgi:hypothetical protein
MSSLGFWLFVVAVALFCVGVGLHSCKQSRECEARGGQWYQPYKSSGVCLKPGSVMP